MMKIAKVGKELEAVLEEIEKLENEKNDRITNNKRRRLPMEKFVNINTDLAIAHMDSIHVDQKKPFNHKYVDRKDSAKYSVEDIANEFIEWVYAVRFYANILPELCITKVSVSSQLDATLAKIRYVGNHKDNAELIVNANYWKFHSDPVNFHSTLCHEAIHLFKDCWGHTNRFKEIGRIMQCIYPKKIFVRTTSTDAGYLSHRYDKIEEHEKAKEAAERAKYGASYTKWPGKYALKCQKCGYVVYRDRMSKIIKSPHLYRCAQCHGTFKAYELKPDGTMNQLVSIRL